MVSTNHIRGEGWTWLRRKRWHGKAVEFLDALTAGRSHMKVDFLTRELEDEALAWLRRHDEREYSFVDATSFAFMRAKGIEEALAFDGDFAAAGFVELRP
jgi:predicted nucleic acid-binding protein